MQVLIPPGTRSPCINRRLAVPHPRPAILQSRNPDLSVPQIRAPGGKERCKWSTIPASPYHRSGSRPTRPNAETRNANVNVSVDVSFDDANRPRASDKRGPSAPGSAARGPATLVPGDAQSIQGRFPLSAIKSPPPHVSIAAGLPEVRRRKQRKRPNRRDSERPGPRRAGALGWNAGMLGRQLSTWSYFRLRPGVMPHSLAVDAASLCFSASHLPDRPMLPGARITGYTCMQLVPCGARDLHKAHDGNGSVAHGLLGRPSHVAARHQLSLLATEDPRPCMQARLLPFSLRMVSDGHKHSHSTASNPSSWPALALRNSCIQ
ncbi:hypothetical protein TRIATDRAFT_87855 [Trichoderma atroviride IMI 206040]|uniref:Uncharacterized protein n=1 Tax=Hypocrea atroviridis (strain ATCC 20476 / IMI 206040) TaxID=452589 RepID=G9NW93_HYPAI|nr:uncharacterized protein TRIATDRAFT_87855 [Trichoderma atroviride IMI 206040]EHK45255.1 hypothetical protein TRIATDRAFT_87855 [Trichoderma atroviride IMI 206040]